MAWIFQGNPNRFDIDDYLSRYSQRIYWRTNRYINEISVGDPVFIWRAGSDAGAVAVGQVVEEPTQAQVVKHPESLGDDRWVADESSPTEFKTGIQLSEVRLSTDEGMVARSTAKDDGTLASSTIITVPNGTVFHLSDDEMATLIHLWGSPIDIFPAAGAVEGNNSSALTMLVSAHRGYAATSCLRFEKNMEAYFARFVGFRRPLIIQSRSLNAHTRFITGTRLRLRSHRCELH